MTSTHLPRATLSTLALVQVATELLLGPLLGLLLGLSLRLLLQLLFWCSFPLFNFV